MARTSSFTVTFDEAAAKAEELTQKYGYTFVHPFNDPEVIAGQGTIALEIMDQLPDVDVIVAPIGGGGLISGLAVAAKNVNPKSRSSVSRPITCRP